MAQSNEFATGSAKVSLLSSFAIYLTSFIARLQTRLSGRNMGTGLTPGFVLLISGSYAIAIRYRYHDAKYSKLWWVGHLLFIAFAIVVGIVAAVMINWGRSPPECEGRQEVISVQKPSAIISIVLSSILPTLCLLFAIAPRLRNKPLLWWWLSLLLVIISLAGLIITNELVIHFDVGIDAKYRDELGEWGIGQIMAMVLVSGQISELVSYCRERTIGCPSRFEVWKAQNFRISEKAQSHEEAVVLMDMQTISENGILVGLDSDCRKCPASKDSVCCVISLYV